MRLRSVYNRVINVVTKSRTRTPANRVDVELDTLEPRVQRRIRARLGPGVRMPQRFHLPTTPVRPREPTAEPVHIPPATGFDMRALFVSACQILMPNVVTQSAAAIASMVGLVVGAATLSVPVAMAWCVVTAASCKLGGELAISNGTKIYAGLRALLAEARQTAGAMATKATQEARELKRQMSQALRRLPGQFKRLVQSSIERFNRGCDATRDFVQDTADSAIRSAPRFAMWAPRVMYRLSRSVVVASATWVQAVWRMLVALAHQASTALADASRSAANMLGWRI